MSNLEDGRVFLDGGVLDDQSGLTQALSHEFGHLNRLTTDESTADDEAGKLRKKIKPEMIWEPKKKG